MYTLIDKCLTMETTLNVGELSFERKLDTINKVVSDGCRKYKTYDR